MAVLKLIFVVQLFLRLISLKVKLCMYNGNILPQMFIVLLYFIGLCEESVYIYAI